MLFEAFKRQRETRAEAPAFLVASGDQALPITWRKFTDDIAAIAWLIGKYAPDAKVGLIGENSYAWMAVHAACLFAGATVVPIDVNLDADEIVRRLRFVGASVLVHSALYAPKAHEVAAKMPGLATGGLGSKKTDQFLAAANAAIAAGFRTVWDSPAPEVKRVSMIVFTSGTTAEPRGVELTVEGLEEFSAYGQEQLRMAEGSRSLMLLPLHHIFGVCTTYLMLAQGVALGVCPDFRRIYDAVERFRANFIFLVPALCDILAAKIEQHATSAEAAFGGPIDWILTGGAPLPRRTYERLTALGVPMLTGYGLTETTSLYSIAPVSGDPHVGSAGAAVKSRFSETRVSAEGELLIRGPSILRGYYRMPQATAKAIDAEGWFHTGDIGRIDADGFVWITGRASRTIILSSGKKVAPEELEEKLHAIPGILEAVVSGDFTTREIRAEVYATIPEASVLRAIGQLNAALPVYQRIKTTVVRSEPFPRTASGKIRLS